MNSLRVGQELARELNGPARQGIINALEHAYAVRESMHDPSIGDDAQYFGLGLYKSATFYLEEFIREDGHREGLKVYQPGQMFAIQTGRILLVPYRLPDRAHGASDDVFPHNHNGAGQVALINRQRLLQRDLFSDEHAFSADVGPKIGIVIAHTGDPDHGLTSVSLREPIDESEGRICKWGYIERLWPEKGSVEEPEEPTFPPEETVSEPGVNVRKSPDITAESSEDGTGPSAASGDES